MSVASHLGIDIAEYDARIRTFIPQYEEMLDVAAALVPVDATTLVDLGTGTGALASRCLARARRGRLVGIDADPEILAVAATRLGDRATFITDSFLRVAVPRCDVITASFALHHVRTRTAKAALYRRLRRSMRRGGRLLTVDCYPARERGLARVQFREWQSHLRRHYSDREARGLLRAWSAEDVYVPLDLEIAMLRAAAFAPEVAWRNGAFAVLIARPA